MGCDIHFVVEMRKKDAAEWVGVYSTDHSPHLASARAVALLFQDESAEKVDPSGFSAEWDYQRPLMKQRNYQFFGALAGVRKDGPEPKGAPSDMSHLARMCVDGWGVDGHSHSHDTLHEFARRWLMTTRTTEVVAMRVIQEGMTFNQLISKVIGNWIMDDTDKEYRVVYWFDN